MVSARQVGWSGCAEYINYFRIFDAGPRPSVVAGAARYIVVVGFWVASRQLNLSYFY
jgi:hypothetical protein